MINIELTMRLKDGKLVVPYQNEVENLALEVIGTAEDIYFDKVPINDDLYLKFDPNIDDWVLHTNCKCNCYV